MKTIKTDLAAATKKKADADAAIAVAEKQKADTEKKRADVVLFEFPGANGQVARCRIPTAATIHYGVFRLLLGSGSDTISERVNKSDGGTELDKLKRLSSEVDVDSPTQEFDYREWAWNTLLSIISTVSVPDLSKFNTLLLSMIPTDWVPDLSAYNSYQIYALSLYGPSFPYAGMTSSIQNALDIENSKRGVIDPATSPYSWEWTTLISMISTGGIPDLSKYDNYQIKALNREYGWLPYRGLRYPPYRSLTPEIQYALNAEDAKRESVDDKPDQSILDQSILDKLKSYSTSGFIEITGKSTSNDSEWAWNTLRSIISTGGVPDLSEYNSYQIYALSYYGPSIGVTSSIQNVLDIENSKRGVIDPETSPYSWEWTTLISMISTGGIPDLSKYDNYQINALNREYGWLPYGGLRYPPYRSLTPEIQYALNAENAKRGEIYIDERAVANNAAAQAWMDTESEYRLMAMKHEQAKEGDKYTSVKYDRWAEAIEP